MNHFQGRDAAVSFCLVDTAALLFCDFVSKCILSGLKKVDTPQAVTDDQRNQNTYQLKTNHLAFTLISCTDWLLVSLSQCADVGYHLSLGRVIKAYLSRRWRAQENLGTGLQQLKGAVSELDQIQDRDTFLQDNYATFSMPLGFTYQPHDGDQVCVHG